MLYFPTYWLTLLRPDDRCRRTCGTRRAGGRGCVALARCTRLWGACAWPRSRCASCRANGSARSPPAGASGRRGGRCAKTPRRATRATSRWIQVRGERIQGRGGHFGQAKTPKKGLRTRSMCSNSPTTDRESMCTVRKGGTWFAE